MVFKKILSNPISIVFTVLMLFSLAACGGNAALQTQPAPTKTQVQSEPTRTRQKTKTSSPTRIPSPTRTPLPAKTLAPVSVSTPLPLGLSRKNPYPDSKVVSVPNWDVQVMAAKRGAAAWQDIQAADPYNEAAPDGMEYLIVKLHVKSRYTDGDEHSLSSCDFSVTGDHLVNYTCDSAGELEPSLDATLSTGGEDEGWATYLVAQGEKKLILVFRELFNPDENAIRYIALDKGASISLSPDLANLQPDDLGKTHTAPLPRGEKLTTRDWELTVNDIVRGDDAWAMVQDANQYNDPPPDGMEYVAVKMHVRYIGKVDRPGSIDWSDFQSTNSAGGLDDLPSLEPPDPPLDISLFPGGEYEGWMVLRAAKGETSVLLVYNALLDNGDEEQRYLSLEP